MRPEVVQAAETDRLIRQAIAGRRLIRFTLDGLDRIGEPHDYGSLKGLARVLVYQLAGGSRSGGPLPDWRLVTVEKISGLQVLDLTFEGPRLGPTGHGHYHWERLYASVTEDPSD